jgi:hypothetical protein
VLVAVAACHKDTPPSAVDSVKPMAIKVAPARDASVALPKHQEMADLPAALHAVIPADARVIGFGELHARTDRAQVKSALAHFTVEGLPAIADQVSDLIVETWIVDQKCGSAAVVATAKVTVTMRRPQETKSEIAQLADAARAAKIQPHAMRVSCSDYEKIAPAGQDVKPEEMLTLTTRELLRIATEAVKHRDAEVGHRPWIALYGGALHNDLIPDPGVEEWSYAVKVDELTQHHFVEIDLIVPELAEGVATLQKQPWYPLVTAADGKVRVWQRGDRSFVIVLPRTATP